jgi:hypothetical protein
MWSAMEILYFALSPRQFKEAAEKTRWEFRVTGRNGAIFCQVECMPWLATLVGVGAFTVNTTAH